MIRYLLDTDTCSYIAKRNRPSVLRRYDRIESDSWAISAVTYAEILYGMEPLPSDHSVRRSVGSFLFSADVLDWPSTAASVYADIRHRTRNQPLHDRDIFIAAHAITLDAILVTNNIRHFSRMGSSLRYENWLE